MRYDTITAYDITIFMAIVVTLIVFLKNIIFSFKCQCNDDCDRKKSFKIYAQILLILHHFKFLKYFKIFAAKLWCQSHQDLSPKYNSCGQNDDPFCQNISERISSTKENVSFQRSCELDMS